MIDMERIYIWEWDERNLKEFKMGKDIWGEKEKWRIGNWIKGSIRGIDMDELIEEIIRDLGINEED